MSQQKDSRRQKEIRVGVGQKHSGRSSRTAAPQLRRKIRFAYFLRGVIMAGRNKQPLSVIQGKGRSNHITKSEKNRREKQEEALRGHTDKIEAPSYLTAAQKGI